jgi:gentisate 1,2-dioxygenase
MDDIQARLIDKSGHQAPTRHLHGDHSLPWWPPIIVPKERIDEEIARLCALPAPDNGVRRTLIVHPFDPQRLGFAPGIDVSLDVLLPGERTKPVRQNSSIVNFCIQGGGSTVMNGRSTSFHQYDVFTTPSMTVHQYVNDTKDVQVRLRYSNGALLSRLNIHLVDENPPPPTAENLTPAAEEIAESHRNPFGTFQLTEDGGWLLPYEKLVAPEPVAIKPHTWPWKKVKAELDKLADLGSSYKGRRLYLLYDPVTGRANGTTPNFFATITIRPAGIADRPHRHASAAMNYYFGGEGHSIVQGKRYEWKAGDFRFSAPGWAVHNHVADKGPVYELTIQDMPFCINADCLLWQEEMGGPISLLGSHAGFETNRAKVAANA